MSPPRVAFFLVTLVKVPPSLFFVDGPPPQFQLAHALEPCQKLAVCALDKCITPADGVFPPKDQVGRGRKAAWSLGSPVAGWERGDPVRPDSGHVSHSLSSLSFSLAQEYNKEWEIPRPLRLWENPPPLSRRARRGPPLRGLLADFKVRTFKRETQRHKYKSGNIPQPTKYRILIRSREKWLPFPIWILLRGKNTSLQLVESLLKRANFACIFGPSCYEACTGCDSCKYAQDQIRKIVLQEETGE